MVTALVTLFAIVLFETVIVLHYGIPWQAMARRRELRRSFPAAAAILEGRIAKAVRRAAGGVPASLPDWARRDAAFFKGHAGHMTGVAKRRLELARRLTRDDPELASALLQEAEAQLGSAEQRLAFAETEIPKLAAEYRASVREFIDWTRAWRERLAAKIAASDAPSGFFRQEAHRVAMLENAFKAHESMLDADPAAVIAWLKAPISALTDVERSLEIKTVYLQRVKAIAETAPRRLQTARSAFLSTQRQWKKFSAHPVPGAFSETRAVLQGFSGLAESVENHLRVAMSLCGSSEPRIMEAAIAAEHAECTLELLERHLLMFFGAQPS